MKPSRLATFAAIALLTACSSSTSVGELNYAIMNDDLTAVRAGIENGANINGTNNEMKARPIHTAAMQGNLTIVRALVEAGAEIDIPDCAGRPPLMYAVKAQSLAVSRYLIEQGARVNRAAGDSTRTCESGSPEDTPLVIAAAVNNAELVRLLLENGATAGGKRAFAFALLDPSREPVARLLRARGYKADEETARMVAAISSQAKSGAAGGAQTGSAQTKTAQASDDDSYTLGDAAVDAVATGVLFSILGF